MIHITPALKIQIEHLDQLQLILENELHLISTRDPEALINLLKSKEALLDQIQQQDQIVEQLYAKLSDTEKQHTELLELFAMAKNSLAQCQFRTDINRTAVEQGQLRLEHLRNLLLAAAAKASMPDCPATEH
jgi:flagellar biosynthesis protein FlgN